MTIQSNISFYGCDKYADRSFDEFERYMATVVLTTEIETGDELEAALSLTIKKLKDSYLEGNYDTESNCLVYIDKMKRGKARCLLVTVRKRNSKSFLSADDIRRFEELVKGVVNQVVDLYAIT